MLELREGAWGWGSLHDVTYVYEFLPEIKGPEPNFFLFPEFCSVLHVPLSLVLTGPGKWEWLCCWSMLNFVRDVENDRKVEKLMPKSTDIQMLQKCEIINYLKMLEKMLVFSVKAYIILYEREQWWTLSFAASFFHQWSTMSPGKGLFCSILVVPGEYSGWQGFGLHVPVNAPPPILFKISSRRDYTLKYSVNSSRNY